MSITFQQIQKNIMEFWQKRGWKNEAPNELITAFNLEVAELGEHFLWKKTWPVMEVEEKKQIAYEAVDILNYLTAILHHCGIEDITPYYVAKMAKLEQKYVVGGDDAKAHKEYRESGKSKNYD